MLVGLVRAIGRRSCPPQRRQRDQEHRGQREGSSHWFASFSERGQISARLVKFQRRPAPS